MPQSDYSFMKAGMGSIQDQNRITNVEENNIMSMLTLFTSNALINAAEYSSICGRNGVTKEDIKYALIFEVFEFLKNPNLLEDLNDVDKELELCDGEDDENWEDIDEPVVPDSEIDSFTRIDIDKVGKDDKYFVEKLHNYYDNWDDWVPSNKLEEILKNAINKA